MARRTRQLATATGLTQELRQEPGYGEGSAIDPAIARDVVETQVNGEAAKTPEARQFAEPELLKTDPIGVELAHDRGRFKYRIALTPDLPADDFKGLMAETVKPILKRSRTVKLADGGKADVFFEFAKDGFRDWSISYLIHKLDDDGRWAKKDDGKYAYNVPHHQVDRIALDTYREIVTAVKQKLGKHEPEPEITF
ncbi:MAG: hypothetical protein ACKVP0_04110 [Pirellulaceae bacterium]